MTGVTAETGFHFHLATPEGEAGIAVFELYGPGAAAALQKAFRPRAKALPEPGRSRLGDLVDLEGGLVDEAVVSNVPPEASWAGLSTWAVSVHAGPWIQEKTVSLLCELGGARLDLRGVLTLSVEAGALDAVQAAAYELLVEARTEKAARFFVRQHVGELSSSLREGLAAAEAGELDKARSILACLLGRSGPAFRLGHPLRVLLAGRPNAGKSTLFNRLVEDERAVVTPIPGTTRDTLEEMIQIEAYPVIVADSAGIRPLASVGEVEREGIRRVHERADDAVVYLVPHPWTWTGEDLAFVARVAPGRVIAVESLADLAPAAPAFPVEAVAHESLRLSALTGEGLDGLRRLIVRRFIDDRDDPARDVPGAPFTARQAKILSRAVAFGAPCAAPGLDAIRAAYIECLHRSWP